VGVLLKHSGRNWMDYYEIVDLSVGVIVAVMFVWIVYLVRP
jgi:large-conductance mechanosensitive channel